MQTEKVFCGLDKDDKPVHEERVIHGTRPLVFRCKTCGHLAHAEHAGSCEQPHACSCCSAGVSFGIDKAKMLAEVKEKYGEAEYLVYEPFPGIFKIIVHTNWEVLHEASDERLTELGLKREQVVKRVPSPSTPNTPKILRRGVTDGPVTQDKLA